MEIHPLPYQKIVFVCGNERPPEVRCSCGASGGKELRDVLKAMVKERRLNGRIRVSQSGCMDRCEKGPNLMVFPDNAWFSHVTHEDLPAILDALAHSLETGNPLCQTE